MKNVRYYGALLFLNLLTAQAVFAGSLGDRFRNWLLGPEARAATLGHEQPALDRIAQACVHCHDGARATHITTKGADAPLQFTISGAQANHPVGMYYDEYSTGKALNYTPRSALNSNIILVDGKVTCVSCHRLKEMETAESLIEVNSGEIPPAPAGTENCSASGKLTVGPRETDLCLACHSM